MIDFKLELYKILKEDPLGILNIKVSRPITADQRLKESFEEINKFIDEHGVEPRQSNDINERNFSAYLRFEVLDKPGVLSNITSVFSTNKVSVKRLIQENLTA